MRTMRQPLSCGCQQVYSWSDTLGTWELQKTEPCKLHSTGVYYVGEATLMARAQRRQI